MAAAKNVRKIVWIFKVNLLLILHECFFSADDVTCQKLYEKFYREKSSMKSFTGLSARDLYIIMRHSFSLNLMPHSVTTITQDHNCSINTTKSSSPTKHQSCKIYKEMKQLILAGILIHITECLVHQNSVLVPGRGKTHSVCGQPIKINWFLNQVWHFMSSGQFWSFRGSAISLTGSLQCKVWAADAWLQIYVRFYLIRWSKIFLLKKGFREGNDNEGCHWSQILVKTEWHILSFQSVPVFGKLSKL